MKKNAKGETVYSEDIFFPAEFRVKSTGMVIMPMCCLQDKMDIMNCLLMGWIQDEMHVSICHQSLN